MTFLDQAREWAEKYGWLDFQGRYVELNSGKIGRIAYLEEYDQITSGAPIKLVNSSGEEGQWVDGSASPGMLPHDWRNVAIVLSEGWDPVTHAMSFREFVKHTQKQVVEVGAQGRKL